MDFCLTNITLILVQSLSICLFYQILIFGKFKGYIIPSRSQSLIENLYMLLGGIVEDNLGKKGLLYFPLIISLCLFILFSNVLGLVPYSFTTTSHFIVTLTISLSVFGIVNIISFQLHGLRAFTAFLPSGTSLSLSFILIPLEILSFFFKPLSLSLRLFANMIAGHTLLKVIGSFSWAMIQKSNLFFILHFIPLLVLVILIGLELGVALIQTYVFIILTCIYLRESIDIH